MPLFPLAAGFTGRGNELATLATIG
jgi:hypothetical protein